MAGNLHLFDESCESVMTKSSKWCGRLVSSRSFSFSSSSSVSYFFFVEQAYNNSLWTFVPLLVAFSSFVVAAATSIKPLTSDIIFPAISLFMLLQFPLAMVRSTGLLQSMVGWHLIVCNDHVVSNRGGGVREPLVKLLASRGVAAGCQKNCI